MEDFAKFGWIVALLAFVVPALAYRVLHVNGFPEYLFWVLFGFYVAALYGKFHFTYLSGGYKLGGDE